MDLIRAQYERIRRQLEGLTASQRMLTVGLVVIMGMTLVYWVKYAGRPEMEALIDQPMSTSDLSRVRDSLRATGTPFEVVGDRIMVPADRREGVFSALMLEQVLPANTTEGWDALVQKLSPWNSENQNAQWWLQVKQAKLAGVIKSWPGVADATVMIDPTERQAFGARAIRPSATVNIRTRDGRRSDKRLAEAAARMVAGAHSTLVDGGRVFVIMNGMSVPVKGVAGGEDSFAGADDLLEQRQEWETAYGEKIERQLRRWMNAEVIATVAVDINTRATQEVSTKYDPKGTAKVETRISTKTNEESTTAPPAGEPGVGANVQASLADMGGGAGGPSQSRNDNEEETEFQAGLSKTETTSREGPGRATVVSAAVRVPQSYFVRVFKEQNPGAKDPDAAALLATMDQELPKIRAEVRNAVMVSDDRQVTVEPYSDLMVVSAEAAAAAAGQPANPGGVTAVVGLHGKEIALGVLAVVSLVMMTMMVRKGTPAPIVHAVPEPQGPVPQLAGGEEVVGEAGDGETVLGGMELDEAAAQTQQMLGQVSDLVKENPDAAANLIKRWMNK